MALRITFHGGADTVTGSNFLVESDHAKVLIDCGIEQGRDFCQECMYAPFPYDVPSIDALVITHAHLDHIGRAPKLMREGFRGKVFMTAPTRDLTEVLLRDSVQILTQEARGHNLPPLYSDDDITAFMSRVEVLPHHEERKIAPGISAYLRHTGHILGSASVRLRADDGTTVALTGDIGNSPSPYLPDWEAVPDADAMVMESVYGDRLHPHLATRENELQETMKRAIERGGTILMPAFSIERTQLMLYELGKLMDSKAIPQIPVFLDSPLAIKVTEIYEQYAADYFNPTAQGEMKKDHDLFDFPFLTRTPSRGDSEKIAQAPDLKLIIAGAGMSHGGRIGRWEQRYLPDPKTTLLIVGYQAPGSPGRMLQDGSPHVKIEGRDVRVRAKVETLSSWSAHADRDGLLKFAQGALPRTKTIFVAIGEPESERFLAQRIHDFLGGHAVVPEASSVWEVTKDGSKKV